MRILFVTSSRIGDAVLSTSLLAHLIARYPGVRITIACGPAAAPLFEAVPGLERIVLLAKKPWGGHWFALWNFATGTTWDMVVDLRASILAWAVWTRERYVFRHNRALGHRLRQLAAVLNLDPPPDPRLWTAPRHEAAAANLIPEGSPVLALGPMANWPRKIWPAAKFAGLAARLTSPSGILANARIAIFGGANERDAAAPVIAAIPPERRIDLVGAADLLTVYACLKRCAFFVGNDSGLMHLAAAAHIPTLGLFGPSRDTLYAPWGKLSAVIRTPESYERLVGGPGYDRLAPGSLMDNLTVDAVERAAKDLWAKTRGTT